MAQRSERSKKPKKIFSPSDPLQPDYYVISYDDDADAYFIIGRSSIQQIKGDKATLNNIEGEARIIASGKILFL